METVYWLNFLGFDLNDIDISGIGVVLGILTVIGIIMTIGLLLHLVQAYGLYQMALRINEPNPWLAFIPFAQAYIIGQILGKVKVGDTVLEKPNLSYAIVGIVLGMFVAGNIPIFGGLVSLAGMIALYVVFYFLFDKYSENAVILIVIGVLTCGLAIPFIVAALRNNEPKGKGVK